jgi:type IV pilus assembly protein PilA
VQDHDIDVESQDRERGFTLIELMVVVLIIAILIAIAIPTFLGARGAAQDRAAQSNLRTALSAQNLYYVNFRTYANPSVTTELDTLRRYEPALQYLTGASPAVTLTGPGQPEVWVSVAGSTLIMAAQATESVCFYLRNDPDPASTTPGQSWGSSDCTTAPATWTAQPPTSS